jgi:citrate synthase
VEHAENRSKEMPMSEPPAVLRYGERELDLPTMVGTEGERAIDISKLRSQTGYVTLDNGFMNTASCESAITFIDGEAGILRYRGIDIEELVSVPSPSFLESAYLLIYGELPTTEQLDDFRFGIRKHTLVHEDVKRFFDGFPKDAHPMATLSSVVTGLSTFYQDSLDPKDPEEAHLSIIRLMAKLPTIAAYAYKKSIGQPYIYPDNSLDLIENFLTMMFAVPSERYQVSSTVVNALKKCLILHADHEQNCSTSTVRLVGSSEVNIYAAIAAGINALWGPLHGGANQMVIEMLEDIDASGGDVGRSVAMAKDPSNPFRLSGFGHRVYKSYDPRAKILKEACDDVLTELGRRDHLLDLAMELEQVALHDEYFIERKLYPNVDFYSGLIYRAMGFPTRMFTVLFAIGRLPGWLAHWKEMMESPTTKIGRPRQIYVGPTKHPYIPIDERA